MEKMIRSIVLAAGLEALTREAARVSVLRRANAARDVQDAAWRRYLYTWGMVRHSQEFLRKEGA